MSDERPRRTHRDTARSVMPTVRWIIAAATIGIAEQHAETLAAHRPVAAIRFNFDRAHRLALRCIRDTAEELLADTVLT
jgi:hypothetical protein